MSTVERAIVFNNRSLSLHISEQWQTDVSSLDMKSIYEKQLFAMMLVFVTAITLVAASGQVPTTHPSFGSGSGSTFQVATIKPGTPDEVRTIQIRGGHQFATPATTLVDVIKYG